MKPHYLVNVYILTDWQGDWREFLKTDDSTQKFHAGSAKFKKDRQFKTAEAAERHCKKIGLERFQIICIMPSEPPSTEYKQILVNEVGLPFKSGLKLAESRRLS